MKAGGLLKSCRTVLPEHARAHAWLKVESERTCGLLRVCLRARDTAREIVENAKITNECTCFAAKPLQNDW